MNYKLKESFYDKDTGISYAKIETPLGEFEGKTKIHKEDIDIESNFFGCELAELRAILKYYKKEKNEIYKKIKIFENIILNLTQLNGYNSKNPENKYMRKQLLILKNQYDKKKNEITLIQTQIEYTINNYRNALNKVYSQIEQNKKKKEKNPNEQ